MKIDNLDQITNEQLAIWIKNDEWDALEYKEKLSEFKKDELPKYYAAYANTYGGLLILGINKQKQTIGFSLSDKDRNMISQHATNCYPHITGIKIEERDYDSKKITLIYIPRSRMIHQDHKNTFPIKVGAIIGYHNIISLIQSLKDRELLTGKIELLEELTRFEKRERKEISLEDIELCLNELKGNNKYIILEGLKDVKMIIYRTNIFGRQDILDEIKKLLDNEDIDIKKESLDIIKDMLKMANSEYKQNLINRYEQKILDIVKKDNLDICMSATKVLIEMDNDNFLESLVSLILREEREYDRFKPSFRDMKITTKKKLKIALNRKLEKNQELSADTIERIRKILEEMRNDYYSQNE